MRWFIPFEKEKIALSIPYAKFMENLLFATGQNRHPLQKSAVRNRLRGYTLLQKKKRFLIKAKNNYLLSTKVRVRGKLVAENEISLFYRPSNESIAIVSFLWFVFALIFIKCCFNYYFYQTTPFFWFFLLGLIFVFQIVQLQLIFNKLQRIRDSIVASYSGYPSKVA